MLESWQQICISPQLEEDKGILFKLINNGSTEQKEMAWYFARKV